MLTDEANLAAQNRFVAAGRNPATVSNRKPFSAIVATILKQTRPTLLRDQRGNSVMWDIINNLYRNYCLARLHEMRKLSIAG